MMVEAEQTYEVIAINDGSTDRTVEVIQSLASEMPITLINFPQNKGVGEVFRKGFQYVLDRAADNDILVCMDADNTHDPRLIRLINSRLKEGYEVVIASCFAPGGMLVGVPALRYLCTVLCNFMYRVLFPVRGLREYTGFYRGYDVAALRRAMEQFESNLMEVDGFAVMAELLIKLRRVPLFITEVPLIPLPTFHSPIQSMNIKTIIQECKHAKYHQATST